MHYKKQKLYLSCLSILFFLLLAKPVHAYVDPGTGSYVLQLVLAFIFGGLFGIKLYWKKIKNFIANIFSRKADIKDEDEK